jgi:hypothetical protein
MAQLLSPDHGIVIDLDVLKSALFSLKERSTNMNHIQLILILTSVIIVAIHTVNSQP